MFRKLADQFNRFMYGRYGADQLYYALLVVFLVLSVVANLFFRPLILLADILFFWALFRYFSKNIYKRREENRKWLAIWQRIKNFFTYQRDRIRDRKTCRYRKCTHCKAITRLPIKKGKHSVKCPRCGKSFSVHIRI